MNEQVNPVHQLYMDLSGRYKAGWTFHRFIQGLRKFFGGQDLDDHTADFQELYADLRESSKQLNNPEVQVVIDGLDAIQDRLEKLLGVLDTEDRRVDPSLVRLFFRRVKTYDERILLDLVRFYIEAQRGRSWESDRIDKVDYIITRLAESVAGEDLSGDRGRMERVLERLSDRLAPGADVDPQKIANRQKMIEAVRSEIAQLPSFEELTERNLVGHYRQVKHGLGNLLFEKSILPMIVETNLSLTARINELTQEEEKRILEDYEKISLLEQQGGVDRELSDSVNRLHLQVSRFRKQLGSGNLRLQDMAQIRNSVLEILDRVEVRTGTPAAEEVAQPDRVAADEGVGYQLEDVLPTETERRLIGRSYEEMIQVLADSAREEDGERRLRAQALAYRLDKRELDAYDRLATGEDCDGELERFVLAAAALRHRINDEVNEVHSYRSHLGGREAAPSKVGLSLLKLADVYQRRFAHWLEEFALRAEPVEARSLKVLSMRLMRDYSGLWLVINT